LSRDTDAVIDGNPGKKEISLQEKKGVLAMGIYLRCGPSGGGGGKKFEEPTGARIMQVRIYGDAHVNALSVKYEVQKKPIRRCTARLLANTASRGPKILMLALLC